MSPRPVPAKFRVADHPPGNWIKRPTVVPPTGAVGAPLDG